MMAAARAAWPEVIVSPEAFASYLVSRAPNGWHDGRLDQGRATELYLACACTSGDPAAVRALEQAFIAPLRAKLLRRGMSEDVVDEALQRLREKLFVAPQQGHGKITEFAGESTLAAWLRVVSTRIAIDILRARKPETSEGDVLEQVPGAASDDPELCHLKSRYGAEFRTALQRAARALTPSERNLLRQHYVDGVTMEALATLHGVHRVTMVRRVVAARDKLGASTRRELLQQFQLGAGELDSVVRLVQSRLGISLRTLFSSNPGR